MNIRFRPVIDPEQRRKLRPAVGDVVLFEGRKFYVRDMGLKYARVEAVDNPREKGIIKVPLLTKWFPDDQLNEPMQLDNLGGV